MTYEDIIEFLSRYAGTVNTMEERIIVGLIFFGIVFSLLGVACLIVCAIDRRK